MERPDVIAAAAQPGSTGARITVPALALSLTLHGAVVAATLWWPPAESASSVSTAAVEVVFWAETPAREAPKAETAMAAAPAAAPPAEPAPVEAPPATEKPAADLMEQAPEPVEPPPPPKAKPVESKPKRVARPSPSPPVERPPEAPSATKEMAASTSPVALADSVPAASNLTAPTATPTQLAALPSPSDMPAAPPLITQARFRSPPAPPAYPRRAIDLGQEGEVIIRALVGSDGESREIRIFRSSGVPLLDEAALRAVKRWAFEAAQINGRAIEAWVEVPVRFQLRTVL